MAIFLSEEDLESPHRVLCEGLESQLEQSGSLRGRPFCKELPARVLPRDNKLRPAGLYYEYRTKLCLLLAVIVSVLTFVRCCCASPRKRDDSLTDRIRFITHQRKQILLVDLSNCSASQVEEIVRAVPELVTTRPHSSVLILSDFTGASLDEEAIR